LLATWVILLSSNILTSLRGGNGEGVLLVLALASKADNEGELRFGYLWKWMAKGIPKIWASMI
jgi:hypothetical protein